MVLRAIISRELVSPSDVVIATGLPRYSVLAMFQCLEAMGFVRPVYSRGSYKLYSATIYAKKLLEILENGYDVAEFIISSRGEAPSNSSLEESIESET